VIVSPPYVGIYSGTPDIVSSIGDRVLAVRATCSCALLVHITWIVIWVGIGHIF